MRSPAFKSLGGILAATSWASASHRGRLWGECVVKRVVVVSVLSLFFSGAAQSQMPSVPVTDVLFDSISEIKTGWAPGPGQAGTLYLGQEFGQTGLAAGAETGDDVRTECHLIPK